MTIFTGTDGNDILTGNDGNNWLNGGAGHDVLTGGGGADVFVVDHGARSWRTTNWVMDFEQGRDKLQMGSDPVWYQGIDTTGDGAVDSTAVYHQAHGRSNYTDPKSHPVLAVLKGFTGRLTVDDFVTGGGRPSKVTEIRQDFTGTDSADILTGNDGNNILAGRGAADVLDGGGGADTADYSASNAGVRVDLSDGAGAGGHAEGDTLISIENVTGSYHADILTGDAGANVLEGGGANDRLVGGAGADRLDGGGGTDTADYSASDAGVTVNLGGSKTGGYITASGGHAEGDRLRNIENLIGSSYDDILTGGGGANILQGGAGADRLDGGRGRDTADYSASDAAVNVDLSTGATSGGHAKEDRLTNIENLTGSRHNDTLTGDGGANILQGGAGADRLDGGEGADTADYSASDAAVTVDLSTGATSGGHAEGDILTGIENLTGSRRNDTLTGDGGANILEGGRGDDTLTGGAGADRLDGGAGRDTADYSASDAGVTVDLSTGATSGGHAEGDILTGIEHVTGSHYDDILIGDGGVNILSGGDGNDTLSGGRKIDILVGDWGVDTVDYSASDAGVTVDLGQPTKWGGFIRPSGGHAEGDRLRDIENVTGSVHDDVLTGDAQNNRITRRQGGRQAQGRRRS